MFPRIVFVAAIAACLLPLAANARTVIIKNDNGSTRVIKREVNDDGSVTIHRKFTNPNTGVSCNSTTFRDGDGAHTSRTCNFSN